MEKELLNDILQWDVAGWTPALEFWEQKIPKDKGKLKCLELGCREGGLSLWLALKGHEVNASDLDDTSSVAQPLHLKYKLQNVSYHNIDATSIPFENYFDVIIFKSILGGIGRMGIEKQEETIRQIYKALKPGGILLFAENLRATLLHEFFRKNFTRWGKEWRYISLDEMKKFLSIFNASEIKTTGFTSVFGRNENQKSFLNKIDRSVFNKIVPASWKYISYGIARK